MTARQDGVAMPARGIAETARSAIKPPNAGIGRTRGVQNRTTAAVKEAILRAFDKVGGEDYLVDLARKDHKTFCTLLGRILPRPVTDEEAELMEFARIIESGALDECVRRVHQELAEESTMNERRIERHP